MRIIDADDLKAKIMFDAPGFLDSGSSITKAYIMAMLGSKAATPTIDAVQVIRCKDCRWYDEKISFCDNCHLPREQTFFCADGKRKDELHEKIDCREDCCGNCVHSIKTDMEGWVVCQIFDCSKTDDMVCNQYEWNLK